MMPSYQESVASERALRANGAGSRAALKIVVGGNANLDFMVPALRVGLAGEGFDSAVRAASFGNWISETFTPDDTDVWVIWLSAMGATRGMTTRLDVDVAAVSSAVGRLIDRGVRVVVVPPEPLIVEEDPFSPFYDWRAALVDDLHRSLPSAAVFLPVEHLVRRVGIDSWTATRYWEQAKAPCHPDAASAVGTEVAVVIARLFKPAIRAVVVDLDDTLWGGLVGEIGPEGLELDPDGLGRSYLEMQQFLQDVSDRGVPIAVVSKNDDDQARRPFNERPEMVLSLDSVVNFAASWRPKYEAIADLAEKLNIGLDSICFLDDSLLERDEARRMLPGLIVPELPAAPGKRVEFLIRSRLFTSPVISDEDRGRVEYYKQSLQAVPENLDGYLESLEMVLEPLVIDHTNRERVLSLLHKTNQFNVTLGDQRRADSARSSTPTRITHTRSG